MQKSELFVFCFFFFKQKTAYEIVDCDWSSDVCSSDLLEPPFAEGFGEQWLQLRPVAGGKRADRGSYPRF